MATCNDCIHCDVCKSFSGVMMGNNAGKLCGGFADKSRFVELPCKVGYTVYSVETAFNAPIESKIYEICFRSGILAFKAARKGYFGIAFTENDIGKTVFFDCREAEAALAERRNE